MKYYKMQNCSSGETGGVHFIQELTCLSLKGLKALEIIFIFAIKSLKRKKAFSYKDPLEFPVKPYEEGKRVLEGDIFFRGKDKDKDLMVFIDEDLVLRLLEKRIYTTEHIASLLGEREYEVYSTIIELSNRGLVKKIDKSKKTNQLRGYSSISKNGQLNSLTPDFVLTLKGYFKLHPFIVLR